MKSAFILVAVLTFLISCNNQSDEPKSPVKIYITQKSPELNLSSPDLTVKSVLKYRDWVADALANIFLEADSLTRKPLNYIFTEEYPDSLKSPLGSFTKSIKTAKRDTYKIEDVKIQTGTRAIVLVQISSTTLGVNHTKVPVELRYTLTKEIKEWLVEYVEKTCSWCDGEGTVKDYDNIYSLNDKICDVCNGTGWIRTDIIGR